jgi:hypothetical protein
LNDDERLADHTYMIVGLRASVVSTLVERECPPASAVTAARSFASLGDPAQASCQQREHTQFDPLRPFKPPVFFFVRERVAFLLRLRKKATERLQSEKLSLKKNR